MIISIEGTNSQITTAVNLLDSADSDFRPAFYGVSESSTNKPVKSILNSTEFDSFRRKRKLGYSLRSKTTRIDVSFSQDDSAKMFVEIVRKSAWAKAEDFVRHLASSKPTFGYACLYDERRYRNELIKKLKTSSIEGWVGRDVARYIPGLYWITLISSSAIANLGADLGAARKLATIDEHIERECLFLKLYEDASQWIECADAVDRVCRSSAGFFSRDSIKEEIAAIENHKDFLSVQRKWP